MSAGKTYKDLMAGSAHLVTGKAESPFMERLYRQYWRELCVFVTQKFGEGPPEPEDVVQHAFAKFAAHQQPENIQNPRAYLYAMARNEVIEYHRKANRQYAHQTELQKDISAENVSVIDAERVLLGREELQVMLDALKKTSARQRRIFLLNRLHGLTCEAIAERESMSVAAVEKHIERATKKCFEAVKKHNQKPVWPFGER